MPGPRSRKRARSACSEAGRPGGGHDLAHRTHAHEPARVDDRDARAHLLHDVDEVRRVEDRAALLGQAAASIPSRGPPSPRPGRSSGSSSTSTSGSWSSAEIQQTFCFVPLERTPIGLSLSASRPNARSSSPMRSRMSRFGESIEAADEGQVLDGRELLEEGARLRDVAQARLHLQRLLEHAVASHQRVTRGGADEAGEDLDGRGLARAVGADVPEHLAPADGERARRARPAWAP